MRGAPTGRVFCLIESLGYSFKLYYDRMFAGEHLCG